MKIFMSWSGEKSQAIAEKFKAFLTKVIQQTQPYISSKDIDLGSVWSRSVMKEATERRFGLIFITPENKSSPWIHYEAGCLIKDLEKDRVVPILFGLKKEDVGSPLSLFQMIEFSKESIFALLTQINNATPNPLESTTLEELFSTFFDKLNEDISKTVDSKGSPKPTRPIDEILDEILLLSRENRSLIEIFREQTLHEILRERKLNQFYSNSDLKHQMTEYKMKMYISQLDMLISQGKSQEVISSFLQSIPDENLRSKMISHFIEIKSNKK